MGRFSAFSAKTQRFLSFAEKCVGEEFGRSQDGFNNAAAGSAIKHGTKRRATRRISSSFMEYQGRAGNIKE
jgi:hypothetical protein